MRTHHCTRMVPTWPCSEMAAGLMVPVVTPHSSKRRSSVPSHAANEAVSSEYVERSSSVPERGDSRVQRNERPVKKGRHSESSAAKRAAGSLTVAASGQPGGR
ncbi:hypothetical protein JY651_42245 [Pyxidicoccus parkwayensis]|uniref:Uncharacterized protein n=1 Tax=Pyxidicoccus parkwayensis TaxID=2813578 RepID=A0ABX7NW69_9BACT|nr:hypothetical protein [Pyxidicoccus parkwaysis]QSQ21712.1 hypothetical protein JY651_42245 [Pyxidicoccus parkwaysis]